MAPPLVDLRFVAVGTGPVLDEAVALLELLGAAVVRFERLAGPVHAQRAALVDALGALDATGSLGEPPYPVVRLASTEPAMAWAASGAAALTGDATGAAWSAPGRLAERLLGVGAVVQLLAACGGAVLDVDPLALLGERAALMAGGRRGSTSIGGYAEIVPCADGWVACNLARPEDVAALPALVDGEAAPGDWPATVAALARRPGTQLAAQAALLGLPLGVWPGPDGVASAAPFRIDGVWPRPRLRPETSTPPDRTSDTASRVPLVVDLSSLWAGPLAGALVGATGARVIKVEGARRPDGARRGPEAFYDLVNYGKEAVALDFALAADLDLLRALLAAADVVFESSRPRVMAQLGIDPAAVARPASATGATATTWISITGYGREGDAATRVAFGDDAAVAAGCTVGDPDARPMFVADAVADPITGLYGAACALAAMVGRRGQVVDLSLVSAAAYARGPGGPRAVPLPTVVAAPHARTALGAARRHGADTEAVRAEFAVASPL